MNKIWSYVKAPFIWVHEKVKKIAPGLKTKTIAALGALGSLAGVLQEYLTGVPLSVFIGVTEALIVSAVLFTLNFWFRSMSK